MRKFSYHGQIITASSKQEAIKILSKKMYMVEYKDHYSNREEEKFSSLKEAEERYDELSERDDIEWVEEPVEVTATRVNRFGSNTTEYAYPVLNELANKLTRIIPNSKLNRISKGYADIETKNNRIIFEFFDNSKNSTMSIFNKDSDSPKAKVTLNNWYDRTIDVLFSDVKSELKSNKVS